MTDLSALVPSLLERSGSLCELCGSDADLEPREVPPVPHPTPDRCVLVCAGCAVGLDGDLSDASRWHCLRESAWSEVPAVQVVSWRLLNQLDAPWAVDLLDQLYLDDDTLAWARESQADDEVVTRDSNGTPLAEGDSVTLIKDLEVKGGGFTAKRGTLVKNIRLTGDPEHIEGRVHNTTIVLKTQFLKKA